MPLCCGIYVNFLFDRDFWAKQPNKYPPGYYWFSTRIRNHIFIGERITLKLNPNSSWHKSISFFYELNTCDLYIINAIANSFWLFIPIFIIGHGLNFALNLLGCYVHDLRLQCLEYFGKFYEDGGKPFKPLMADTKYVDITK